MEDVWAVWRYHTGYHFIFKGVKNEGVIFKNAVLEMHSCTRVYIDIAVFL